MREQGLVHRVVHGERGTILVIGLVGAFVATLLAIALFDVSVVQSRLQRDNVCTHRAVHAAEAGLLRAFQDIERAPAGTALNFNTLWSEIGGGTLTTTLAPLPGAYADVPFRTGIPDTYSVKARKVAGAGRRIIRLVSTGTVLTGCLQEGGKGGVAYVQADLTRQSTPLGAPFVGKDSIKLNKDKVFTNSYDSFVGKYTDSSCPQFDAKGKPLKVLGCGGDMWTDGTDAVANPDKCDKAPLCMKGGSTVYGDITAAKGEIWIEGKKDKVGGAIWGDATYDSTPGEFGNIFCKAQPGCVDTKDPSKSVVQGSIVKGAIPAINLSDVNTCLTDPTDAPGGYTTKDWLNGVAPGSVRPQVVAENALGVFGCSDEKKVTDTNPCFYDQSKGTLTVDKASVVKVWQGQYCLGTVTIKNPIQLIYAGPVQPIQWNVTGPVKLDDKVAKGTTPGESENDPWNFQILSGCGPPGCRICAGPTDTNCCLTTGCKDNGVEVKIGTKAAGEGLYGYIYAPRAPIKVNGDGDLFGAAAGRKLTVDNGQLHFDLALLNLVEICAQRGEACHIPNYLQSKPVDKLLKWKHCVVPVDGECP